MVGIAGIIYPDVFQVDHQALVRSLDTLTHRGGITPHIHTFKNFQVGCCGRELTVVGNSVVGLNGILYNTQKVRKELRELGVNAEQASDEELIALAYKVWGESFLRHIEGGSFAFFLLDQEKEQLILGRDRIGKKPLFWFHDGRHFVFGSEIKALLATGIIPQTLALDGVASYLYLSFTPQDLTAVKGVNKLLPAHYLQCSKDHAKNIEPYWSYSSFYQQRISDNSEMILQRVDQLLTDSVAQCIPKNTQFGCMVSGGLGSAGIAYYLRKLVPNDPISAFTVAFQDETVDDLRTAKEVARSLDLTHTYQVITPKTFLDHLVKIIWYLDEPIADPNIIASWRLADLAASVGVVFSGMGSDELLAGHQRYTAEERKIRYSHWITQLAMPFFRRLLPMLNLVSKRNVFNILQLARTSPWQLDYLEQNSLFPLKVLNAAAPKIAPLFDPYAFLHRFFNLSHISSPVASFLYLDVKTRLPDCYITQYERFTTAHNVDWRVPFLDQYLEEYLAGILEAEIIESKGTSAILKGILKGVFPQDVVYRPKKTRRDLLKLWIESSGLSEIFKLLPQGVLVEWRIISENWLNKQLATPEQQRESFRYLWALLILEVWCRLFISGPSTNRPPEIPLREFLLQK